MRFLPLQEINMESVQAIKQRLGIIGNDPTFNTIRKIFLIICFFIFVFSCQRNDDSGENTEQVNPDDLDGDGVTNQQEVVDNTNPDNPCSFRLSSQYYPSVSSTWKELDCDGDGVTNWDELDPDGNDAVNNNGTNPKLPCEFNIENRTLDTTNEWKQLNCDDDFVSNGQEELDGTDFLDSCDFVAESQDLDAEDYWLGLDCDNDGRTNERELYDNTDLLDPNDFDGAGNNLKEFYQGTRHSYTLKHVFSNNGTLYDKIERFDGSLITDFEYDDMNRLVSVFIDDDTDIHYTFSYVDDQISQVTRTQGSDVYSYNVVYEGNIIYTYDGTEPQGLYSQKFTFNDVDKPTSREVIYNNGNSYIVENFEYDGNFENLISASVDSFGYNLDTNEIYELEASQRYQNVKDFSYNQNEIVNPLYNAYQNIFMNIVLSSTAVSSTTEIISRTFFPNLGSISTNFLNQSGFWYDTGLYSDSWFFGYAMDNTQSNGLPTNILKGGFDAIIYEVHYEN